MSRTIIRIFDLAISTSNQSCVDDFMARVRGLLSRRLSERRGNLVEVTKFRAKCPP
jgi:hypothetical protein